MGIKKFLAGLKVEPKKNNVKENEEIKGEPLEIFPALKRLEAAIFEIEEIQQNIQQEKSNNSEEDYKKSMSIIWDARDQIRNLANVYVKREINEVEARRKADTTLFNLKKDLGIFNDKEEYEQEH